MNQYCLISSKRSVYTLELYHIEVLRYFAIHVYIWKCYSREGTERMIILMNCFVPLPQMKTFHLCFNLDHFNALWLFIFLHSLICWF